MTPRMLDLSTFWHLLQKSTKWRPGGSIWALSGLGARSRQNDAQDARFEHFLALASEVDKMRNVKYVVICVALFCSDVKYVVICVSLTVFGVLGEHLLTLFAWVSLCLGSLESNCWRYLHESRYVWGSSKAIIDAICVSLAMFGALGKQLLTLFAWVSLCLSQRPRDLKMHTTMQFMQEKWLIWTTDWLTERVCEWPRPKGMHEKCLIWTTELKGFVNRVICMVFVAFS